MHGVSKFVPTEKRIETVSRTDLTTQQKAAMLVEEAQEEARKQVSEGAIREVDDATAVLATLPDPHRKTEVWQRLVRLYSPDTQSD